eukprot:6475304-Amphidinium_carterae.3
MRKACKRSTACPQPAGRPHVAVTNRSLNQDAAFATVHVESDIEGIERIPTLNGKLFKYTKRFYNQETHQLDASLRHCVLQSAKTQALDSGLAIQALRQLKLDGQSQKDNVKSVLNAALGGVWHEARVHSVFEEVGEFSVRCGEAVEDLEHIVHHCPSPGSVSGWGSNRVDESSPVGQRCGWRARGPCGSAGNRMADVAANNGTREHLPLEPSEEWKHWCKVYQAVHNLLLVGPKLCARPEQWPSVRLPDRSLEPELVESARTAALPSAPFAISPHQHVVEHETHAICLDCQRHLRVHTGRKYFNHRALKGRPCVLLKRNKRANLSPDSHGDDVAASVYSAVSGGGEAPPGRCWLSEVTLQEQCAADL